MIPDFGEASTCVQENRLFCPDWVRDNWGPVLQPALLQHVKLTVIAVAIGFVLAFAAALVARHRSWFERPFDLFSALVYTIPSLALFQLLVPITGLTVTTVEVALVSYTLLILFRNILAGFRVGPRRRARGRARDGDGLVPGAPAGRAARSRCPAIMAGVRIATVSTIALATVAAFVIPEGLGRPIFLALRQFFNTELIVTAILAVGLALVADGLLVLAQRALTPWTRIKARDRDRRPLRVRRRRCASSRRTRACSGTRRSSSSSCRRPPSASRCSSRCRSGSASATCGATPSSRSASRTSAARCRRSP